MSSLVPGSGIICIEVYAAESASQLGFFIASRFQIRGWLDEWLKHEALAAYGVDYVYLSIGALPRSSGIFFSALGLNRLFGSLNWVFFSRLCHGRSSTRSVLWPFYLYHRNGYFRILEQKDERPFILLWYNMWQRNGTAVSPNITMSKFML